MKPIAAFALVAAVSCAGGSNIIVPGVPGGPVTKPSRPGPAFPGFDKRDFPGLAQMQTWYSRSPYTWVGYYLPSPCYAGVAWTGHRQQLIDQGWGLAIIYVGLQARGSALMADSSRASSTAAATRCSQNTLSAEQGRIDADDAVSIATADGFSEGTTIFLDVERADPYPADLDLYVRAWVGRVLELRFTPGIYGHRINAETLFNTAKAVYVAAGDMRQPPFWVANSQGFGLDKTPAQSGFSFATVWQNPSDANETHGGVTFRIDSNVSTTRSPSQP